MTDQERNKFRTAITALRDMKNLQCGNGIYNYDPYMLGMANGLILALSMFTGETPEYLDAPEEWLSENELDK